jgi:hypothetical protein
VTLCGFDMLRGRAGFRLPMSSAIGIGMFVVDALWA